MSIHMVYTNKQLFFIMEGVVVIFLCQGVGGGYYYLSRRGVVAIYFCRGGGGIFFVEKGDVVIYFISLIDCHCIIVHVSVCIQGVDVLSDTL